MEETDVTEESGGIEERESVDVAEDIEVPPPPREPQDVRPVVATGTPSNWGLWIFLGVLLIGGATLFNALNASRDQARMSSVIQPSEGSGIRIASPSPLRVPERFSERSLPAPSSLALTEALSEESAQSLPPSAPAPTIPVRSLEPTSPVISPTPFLPRPELEQSRVVFDGRSARTPQALPASSEGDAGRVQAGRLVNPAHTIPQGTVIPAVLETALDSTRGGGVRALVQRDMFGFDGTRKLIPRGSRLYGEYEADLRPGQKRALVQWTRLIRPDGVTIALDSPSSDPLGRAGIRGKVDSKFLQRFGGALLQSI
ncbi:TrbI/VirB10 family protein, partial [uncultured Erythrobacter sp.]|uniref:TrbI/VirB10 family protein n=1 Tax=uncultured Erythrobacter sp. TaxID=263913 RepID=UPI002625AF93